MTLYIVGLGLIQVLSRGSSNQLHTYVSRPAIDLVQRSGCLAEPALNLATSLDLSGMAESTCDLDCVGVSKKAGLAYAIFNCQRCLQLDTAAVPVCEAKRRAAQDPVLC